MQIKATNLKYQNPLIPLNLEKVIFIILHHADAVTATPEQIHSWHIANGWNGFGYNEYIRKDGTIYIGRGDNIGAQCANMNSKSYGICCEGDFSRETDMPEAQFASLVERIKYNKARFKNCVEVALHSKFYNTDCPGKYFPFRSVLEALNPKPDELHVAVDMLVKMGIINSPDYWLENAIKGKTVDGDYAGALIKKMAIKLGAVFP